MYIDFLFCLGPVLQGSESEANWEAGIGVGGRI